MQSRIFFRVSFEQVLGIVGFAVCIFITVRIWQFTELVQPMWPIPAAYLLELIGLGIISAIDLLLGDSRLTWVAVGAYFAVVVLGGFSIGFFYLPIALTFLVAAIASDVRHHCNIGISFFLALIALMAQVALMLTVIGLV